MEDFSGRSFGRYKLVEVLSMNGMATVYRAQDTHLECDVAVRILHTENLPQNELEPALQLFERGAKTIAHLAHENIVRCLDYGEFEGHPYLVMEYLSGGTLKTQLVKHGAIPWQTTVQLLTPITRALASLHAAGVIHGELRPVRILFTSSGTPMLAFYATTGLSTDAAAKGVAGILSGQSQAEYIAPEYVTSTSVDARADIYSLGIIFYEMITGRTPFQAATPLAVLFKHATEPLPAPSQFTPELPAVVEQIIFKALEKKPEARYASMDEFTQALSQVSMASSLPVPEVALPISSMPETGSKITDDLSPTPQKPDVLAEPIPSPNLPMPETAPKDSPPVRISTMEVAAPAAAPISSLEPAPSPESALLPHPSIQKTSSKDLPQAPSPEPVPPPLPIKAVESPAPIRTTCPKCGHAISPNHRFCTKCGAKIN